MHMLHHRPRDGQAVISSRAPADFIKNHQRAGRGQIKDGGGFHHLNHKGGAAPRQIIGRAHTAEQFIHHADMCGSRRDISPQLRQHHQQRILAQEGGLTRHVGAGQQPQALAVIQIAVICDKGRACFGAQRSFNHWMATPGNDKRCAVIHHRAAPALMCSQLGQTGRHIQHGQRMSCHAQIILHSQNAAAQLFEQLNLQCLCARRGLRQITLKLGQLGCCKAHGPRHGLTVDKGGRERRRQQLVGLRG